MLAKNAPKLSENFGHFFFKAKTWREAQSRRKQNLTHEHFRESAHENVHEIREVLHVVGADGVGVKFPIFAEIAVVCPCPLGEEEKNEEKGEKCLNKGEDCVKKGENCVKKGKSLRPHLHQLH